MNQAANPSSDFLHVNYLSSDDISIPPVLTKNDPIEILGFPVRLENTLKRAADVTTVGQFMAMDDTKLLKLRNLGPKSVDYFIQVKKRIKKEIGELEEGRSPKEASEEPTPKITVPSNQLVTVLLERCGNEKAKDVIKRRYGLINGDKQTLEEIGESYGVTRERIRQIQAKSLKKMGHPITFVKQPIIELTEKIIYQNGGLLSAEEADSKIPEIFGGIADDGSSLLDLFCDLGWIQSYKIGDVSVYAPLFGVSLEKVSQKIISLVKTGDIGIHDRDLANEVSEFRKITDNRFNRLTFILRYCQIDPRIEELRLGSGSERIFTHYTSGNFAKKGWVSLMIRVLEEEQMPLHFTEIANKVNDILDNSERIMDVRRAHSLLIETPDFAHSGIHGTYGLTSWGLRKDTTKELVEECLKKAGFPLHWKQIYNYVSKYKDSKPGSIVSILENKNKFRKVDSGTYWLLEQ